MMQKEELSCPNNELASEQSDKIIEIIKSVQKTLRCKFNECAKKYGFTAPQLAVIVHLYKMPGITLHELSNHLMLTKSTVSGIVDRLSKQGVVVREIPKNNRRTVKLSIEENFKNNNDIDSMKKEFISHIISDAVKNMDAEKVDKIIYGLQEFSLLLQNSKCE
ncbi:MarR family winged helix-turn-helix transcriptional regulator [Clostridium drakei]|uniref:MarR family transcriptional regulator n=1 Tax=Clostridium drakei TaxID=332101 RepID=A0A2U8DKW1_9CLOT|nr:MarR family transcriptional regulator [Clostridium drakei]AWI03081.1 MarR family transcriptional regulator [Clostridium drakei]